MSENQPVRIESSFRRSLRTRMESFIRSFYFLTRNPLAVFGLAVALFYLLVAIFGPIIVGGDPNTMKQYLIINGRNVYTNPLPPSLRFPFGLTFGGYDLLNGIVKGARTDLMISAVIILIGAIIGIALGALAGYTGGVVDDIIMRVTDIFLSIPFLVLAIAMLAILGRTLTIMVAAFVIVWWPTYTRIIRGQVLTVRELNYVEASRAAGAGSLRVIGRHILPNSIYPLFVQGSLDFGNVIIGFATLNWLGFGYANYALAEWGSIMNLATLEGTNAVFHYSWTLLIPGFTILLFVLALNFLGDGLRDVLDPKLRR
ncbi:MAG: ABC transporter permease [Candidatus Thermoplasmatota archaeon]|jgi:peptide/nickel transport system permease protein|nr:ABC transporter permease [Candidatus Thermoplasmatota archaeon]MCL5680751.1 ABC transporter permease [Candidatus Thermoplasmatota archaeon]